MRRALLVLPALLLALAACDDEPSSGEEGDGGGATGGGGGSGGSGGGAGGTGGTPACPAEAVLAGRTLSSAGVDHDAVTGEEVWTAEDSPHRIGPAGLTLDAGKRVVVEPCAVVLVEGGVTISVDGGTLELGGTPDEPVVVAAKDPAVPWGQLLVSELGAGSDLSSVTLRDGGAAGLGVVETTTMIALPVHGLTVEGGAAAGVWLSDGATFAAGSSGIAVDGAAGPAVSTDVAGASSVPDVTGSAIELRAGVTHRSELRLGDRGAPWLVRGALRMEGAALVLEPSAHLRFASLGAPGPNLTIAGGARLTADGGAEETRIVLEGETEGPGTWGGVSIVASADGTPPRQSQLRFVTIRGAGGIGYDAASDACVDVRADRARAALEVGVPNLVLIRDTEVRDVGELGFGILRDYCGTGATEYTVEALGNVFGGAMHCPETNQQPCPETNPVCEPAPANPYCCDHPFVCYGTVVP